MPRRKAATVRKVLWLTPEEWFLLRALAADLHLYPAQVLRGMIRYAERHVRRYDRTLGEWREELGES